MTTVFKNGKKYLFAHSDRVNEALLNSNIQNIMNNDNPTLGGEKSREGLDGMLTAKTKRQKLFEENDSRFLSLGFKRDECDSSFLYEKWLYSENVVKELSI